MIFDILKDAIDYTSYNRISVGKLGLLYLFSFLFIPLLVIEGYTYNIINASLNGVINLMDDIPKIEFSSKTLKNSVKIIFVKIFYLIPFIAVMFYGVFIFINTADYIDEFILLNLILFIIGFFSYTISVVHMIYHNSFIKAFDLPGILKLIKEIGVSIYLKLFISMLIAIIGSTVLAAFLIAIVSLIITWFVTVDFKFLTITLSILSFCMILLPTYTVFKNRAISSIYNLR